MKTLALYHVKGGVGKTATAVNLSYLAARTGNRTLICDLDPQGAATFYFRVKPKFKSGARGFTRGGKRIEQNIKGTDYENLDLLPADFSYRNLDIEFDRAKRPKHRLSEILASLTDEYEYVFLDCPPNINIVAENTFRAADFIVVPLVPTTLSVRTYEQLLSFFEKKEYQRQKILAFFSMVEKRKTIHRETMAEIPTRFSGILSTAVPYLAEVEKMGVFREPVTCFAPTSPASEVYRALWEELRAVVQSSP